MEVKFVRTDDKVKIPEYATPLSAGADIRARIDEPITVKPHARVMVPTGLKISLPEGYAALLYARSGLATKHGIALSNGVGVIDADYRGEIKVGLINLSDEEFIINDGERIAQLVITPIIQAKFTETDTLDETLRGEGGFGSTGRK